MPGNHSSSLSTPYCASTRSPTTGACEEGREEADPLSSRGRFAGALGLVATLGSGFHLASVASLPLTHLPPLSGWHGFLKVTLRLCGSGDGMLNLQTWMPQGRVNPTLVPGRSPSIDRWSFGSISSTLVDQPLSLHCRD